MGVFAETCLGLFLFLLGLRCLFREYFKLRLYLFSSLGFPPLSARSHPEEQGSEDQAASQEVGAGTDLFAFPSGSSPGAVALGGGQDVHVRSGWCRLVVSLSQHLPPARVHSTVIGGKSFCSLSHRAQMRGASSPGDLCLLEKWLGLILLARGLLS